MIWIIQVKVRHMNLAARGPSPILYSRLRRGYTEWETQSSVLICVVRLFKLRYQEVIVGIEFDEFHLLDHQ